MPKRSPYDHPFVVVAIIVGVVVSVVVSIQFKELNISFVLDLNGP